MTKEFNATIKQHEDMNAAYVQVPFDVRDVYGAKRVKVTASFDGIPYRGSIVSMGGSYVIGMTQEIRKQIGKTFGDTVSVRVEKDDAERTVELPDDFAAQLKTNDRAQHFFDSLSYTQKKEYVNWITSAKKAETRESRISQALSMLAEGLKR